LQKLVLQFWSEVFEILLSILGKRTISVFNFNLDEFRQLIAAVQVYNLLLFTFVQSVLYQQLLLEYSRTIFALFSFFMHLLQLPMPILFSLAKVKA
jgi:hypothetical protein